ncbi:MAG: NlpC/P60 family protein [Polyangiaceae bacterium]
MRLVRPLLALILVAAAAGCARSWARSSAPTSAPASPAPSPVGIEAARFAQGLEGEPYCWGGGGPDCYDAVGLAHRAWASVGVILPRDAEEMRRRLPPVHWSLVQPGDVLWRPGHVALYVERGWAIHVVEPEATAAPGAGGSESSTPGAVVYEPANAYQVALRPWSE